MNHSLSNLRYRLLYGEVPMEPLRILRSRTRLWNGWQVVFHILGTSHAVQLSRDGQRLTELLTCQPTALAPEAVRCEASAEQEGALRHDGPDFHVVTRLTPFPLDADTSDALCGPFPARSRMTQQFPAPPGCRAPVTRLGWRTQGRVLTVETIHTYPEERQAVRSVTAFAWQGDRRPWPS